MAIDMRKKVQLVKESANRAGIDGKKFAVSFFIDRSLSMKKDYLNGLVQSLFEAMTAAATTFDDDGDLAAYAFESRAHRLPIVNERNIEGYVKKYVESIRYGSTNLTDALDMFVHDNTTETKKMFKKAEVTPVLGEKLLFIVTDGSPDSRSSVKTLLRELSKLDVHVIFIAVGSNDSAKQFLESLDEGIPGCHDFINTVDAEKYVNGGEINITALMDDALSEVRSWLQSKPTVTA